MRVDGIIGFGGIAALATVLALAAAPANAQERGEGRWGGERGGGAAVSRGDGAPGGGWNRGGDPSAADNGQGQNGRSENDRGGRGMGWRDGQANEAPEAPERPAPVQAERRNWGGNVVLPGNRSYSGQAGVNRPPASGQWRDDNAPENRWRSDTAQANRWRGDTVQANRWRSGNGWSNNRGNGWGNAWQGGGWQGDRRNYAGNWNRDWRRDSRYDWRGYRNANRDVYRLGTYYAPSRNWSYRRLTAGFQLDAMFFGSRYLIDDPWQYRLPPTDGPFRWVRYYDDALLVDTYSGEVVDVIYAFFW